MKIKSVTFVKSANNYQACPEDTCPEIVFLGRSNVGKSSFINFICQRKQMAKVSRTPGKTLLWNFFSVNNNLLRMVDTPGYGYTKTGRQVLARIWNKTLYFLKHRTNLVTAVFLLDIRHQPNQKDVALFRYLSYRCPPQILIVFTKIDKLKKYQINHQVAVILQKLDPPTKVPYFLASSLKQIGFDDFWTYIGQQLDKTSL